MAAKDRIRAFFIANVGRIVSTQEVARVAGIREYARRIRELRDEEGFQIRSHLDRADLKPGEYILETLEQKPAVGRMISPQLRNYILERNGYTCQLCGAGPGDPDPFHADRKIRLHVDHMIPVSQGGADDESNLRVLCSACNQGRANVQPPSETALNILARIRKLSKAEQQQIFAFLKRKFQPEE